MGWRIWAGEGSIDPRSSIFIINSKRGPVHTKQHGLESDCKGEWETWNFVVSVFELYNMIHAATLFS